MAFIIDLSKVLNHPIPTIDILDIGAMEQGADRYLPLMVTGLGRVTGFEPNPDEFAKLQARGGPFRYLPYFLGTGEPAIFYRTFYPGCSSLLEPDPAVIDLFMEMACARPDGNFHVVETFPVETKRLDDISGIACDLIKLDVQGYELEILRHGTKTLANALVIECEVEFVPLYKNQPLFGDVQLFLREHGFVLHKLIDVGGRPFSPYEIEKPDAPISQLLWADAIFVKDFTKLNRYSDDDLLKAAAILDLVYNSYDLAGLLLKEFDRRSGTSLCARYNDAFTKRRLEPKFLNLG